MGSLYRTSEGNLVLYAQDEKIYARSLMRDSVGRAVVLASDYRSDLSDVLFHGIVFYAYKNREGDVVIRNITEGGVWYRLGAEEKSQGNYPRLAVIDDVLFLWYLIQDPLDRSYQLCCRVPEKRDRDKPVAVQWLRQMVQQTKMTGLTEPPQVVAFVQGTLVMIGAERMFWWSPEDGWSSLARFKDLEKELVRKDQLIQSIKTQYEDLMQVAFKYREEAVKWRSKFTDG